MRLILTLILGLGLISCGYLEGEDGKDGAKGPKGKQGPAGKHHEHDEIISAKNCHVDLVYKGDPAAYRMSYSEILLVSKDVIASLKYYQAKSKKVIFQESAVFAPGETVRIESPSWQVEAGVLMHKPTGKKYNFKCKAS